MCWILRMWADKENRLSDHDFRAAARYIEEGEAEEAYQKMRKASPIRAFVTYRASDGFWSVGIRGAGSYYVRHIARHADTLLDPRCPFCQL